MHHKQKVSCSPPVPALLRHPSTPLSLLTPTPLSPPALPPQTLAGADVCPCHLSLVTPLCPPAPTSAPLAPPPPPPPCGPSDRVGVCQRDGDGSPDASLAHLLPSAHLAAAAAAVEQASWAQLGRRILSRSLFCITDIQMSK